MILLDTHAWLWWAGNRKELFSEKATETISPAEFLGVNIISGWEIAMLVAKNRLVLKLDVQDWLIIAANRPGIRLLDISLEILVLSTRLQGNFHRDPADRVIAATALKCGVPLITKNRQLREYQHIQTIW